MFTLLGKHQVGQHSISNRSAFYVEYVSTSLCRSALGECMQGLDPSVRLVHLQGSWWRASERSSLRETASDRRWRKRSQNRSPWQRSRWRCGGRWCRASSEWTRCHRWPAYRSWPSGRIGTCRTKKTRCVHTNVHKVEMTRTKWLYTNHLHIREGQEMFSNYRPSVSAHELLGPAVWASFSYSNFHYCYNLLVNEMNK